MYAAKFGEKLVEMTREDGRVLEVLESKALISIQVMDEEQLEQTVKEMEQEHALFKVWRKRLSFALPQVNCDARAQLWLFFLAQNPGDVVMLLAVLAYVAQLPDVVTNGPFGLVEVIYHAFPTHVPTQEIMQSMWDSQKDEHGRNLLDLQESWR